MIKRIIAIFILTFMVGSMLVSCSVLPFWNKAPEENSNQQSGDNNNDVKEETEPPITPNTNHTDPEPTPDPEPNPQPEPDPEPALSYTVGTEIGNLMKAVSLERINGEGTVSIEDYKGKIIIFNLWATWCPPCVGELPEFSEFADDYADDVVIIAAHTAYRNSNALNYVSNNFADSSIIFAYDTPNDAAYVAAGGDGYVPYTVILDRNGVIVYSDSGPLSYAELKQMVDKLK